MCTEKDEMGHRRKKEDFGGKYEKRKETERGADRCCWTCRLIVFIFSAFFDVPRLKRKS